MRKVHSSIPSLLSTLDFELESEDKNEDDDVISSYVRAHNLNLVFPDPDLSVGSRHTIHPGLHYCQFKVSNYRDHLLRSIPPLLSLRSFAFFCHHTSTFQRTATLLLHSRFFNTLVEVKVFPPLPYTRECTPPTRPVRIQSYTLAQKLKRHLQTIIMPVQLRISRHSPACANLIAMVHSSRYGW